jgi:translation initiation factor IF-1
MQTEVAVALGGDWPSCLIRRLGSDVSVVARLSDLMVERRINVRPGDVVSVDFEADPPEVLYRWWKATVVSVTGNVVEVASSATDETSAGTVRATALEELGVMPRVADTVLLMTGEDGGPIVVDVVVDGEPEHPERFTEEYEHVRRVIAERR